MYLLVPGENACTVVCVLRTLIAIYVPIETFGKVYANCLTKCTTKSFLLTMMDNYMLLSFNLVGILHMWGDDTKSVVHLKSKKKKKIQFIQAN